MCECLLLPLPIIITTQGNFLILWQKSSDESSTGCCCLPLLPPSLQISAHDIYISYVNPSLCFLQRWSLAQSFIKGAFLKWNKDRFILCPSDRDFDFSGFFTSEQRSMLRSSTCHPDKVRVGGAAGVREHFVKFVPFGPNGGWYVGIWGPPRLYGTFRVPPWLHGRQR